MSEPDNIPDLAERSPVYPVKFTKLWELKETHAVWNPESIFFDPERDCIWVVNTADGATKSGFLSKISINGDVLDENILDGLLAPRGSEICGNSLYFNQLQDLTEMDLDTCQIVHAYHASEAILLNDIGIDQDGHVYSSDILGDAIYRLADGHFDKWLQDIDGLERPNGLLCQGDKMYLCPWGAGDHSTWETTTASIMKVIDLNTKEIRALGDSRIGPLDGLEEFDPGHLIISNWWLGKIYIVNKVTGQTFMALDTHEQSAGDIHYIVDQGILLIPYGNLDKIVAYKIDTES
jgi:hypothetical protein